MSTESEIQVTIKRPDDLRDVQFGLPYPPDNYPRVTDQPYPILLRYFQVSTASATRALCDALGCQQRDFSTHFIDTKKIQFNRLRSFCKTYGFTDAEYAEFCKLCVNYSDIQIMFVPDF